MWTIYVLRSAIIVRSSTEADLDVLSDILATVRLRSTVFAQTQLAAPWGIRAEQREHFAFHVIARGRGVLDVDGLGSSEVEAGEVVVIAPGRGHTLRDRPETPARDLSELLSDGVFISRPGAGLPTPRDGPATTHLICGCFRFEDMRHNVLVSALPTMIHTREMANDVGPWLAQTIKLLAYESLADRPGMTTVVNRLCDAMFVYVLRSYLAALPAHESNWLRALVEPQIGTALRLIHDEPSNPWTVATLATRVAMSRSAFAALFTRVVGESPMQYLTRWRLQKAAGMLRSGDTELAAIAARVGYESPAAFSKAFKRMVGTSPGAYRRSGQPDAA